MHVICVVIFVFVYVERERERERFITSVCVCLGLNSPAYLHGACDVATISPSHRLRRCPFEFKYASGLAECTPR